VERHLREVAKKLRAGDTVSTQTVPTPPPPPGLPLVAVVRYGASYQWPQHEHAQGQLLYPEHGYVLLETDCRVVRLAADRAAWIPGGATHSVLMDRSFRYHSLYIDPAFVPVIDFLVVHVTPLLRGLILDAPSWLGTPGELEREIRKATVLRDELMRATRLAPGVEIPVEPRLAVVCRAIEHNPSDGRSIEEWSRKANVSAKTIQRLFVTHTGLTFQQWRTYVRMNRALEMHVGKHRLLDIALAVGYSTESAFCQAFKRFYGYPPSRVTPDP
jgi:AraC-like DNA-binding protein